MKLNGDIPVEVRRHNASSKPLRTADRSTLSFQLEFLDSCAFQCPGCFVKRRNEYSEQDLDILNALAHDFNERGYEMNEIILGPTDLFGCRNAEQILSDPKFASLFDHFQALTFASTLQSEHDHIKKIVDLIHANLPDSIYLEMFIVFDISKYNEDKKEYLAVLEENLKLLQDANIIFAFNIHDSAFDQIAYEKISKKINKIYNSHLKMVPSFFRSPNLDKKFDNLEMWKERLNKTITKKNASKILNNMADQHFGGYTYFTYVYRAGELYASPYIYDFIFDKNDGFLIPSNRDGTYSVDKILEWEKQNIIDQFKYADITNECESCPFLSSCVGKKVLTYMENYGIMGCFLPKESMKLQNNIHEHSNTNTSDK